jgi:hypothetical protein
MDMELVEEMELVEDSPIHRAQFQGEVKARKVIEEDRDLVALLEEVARVGGALDARRHMLSQAVRVNPKILPGLARSFREVQERAQIDEPLEAYIHAGAEINAAVLPVRDRKLVLLSSAAVERLSPQELDFVIGHELGHALMGHLDYPVKAVLAGGARIEPRQAMRLMAWLRKCEISADRAGLLCCGSLDVAATALFKTLSGLSVEGLQVDVQEFSSQWDELAEEVRREGTDDYWRATHPFPPLRAKALDLFWRARETRELVPSAPGGKRSLAEADRAIDRYLGMMDPLAREEGGDEASGADPLLTPFLLWGGLYVAAANNKVEPEELASIRSLVGREALKKALASTKPSKRTYLKKFRAAKDERRRALKALELHRIFSGLSAIAWADGTVDDDEVEALHGLAKLCGVSPGFVDMLIQNKGNA